MSGFKKNTAVTGFPFTLVSATDNSAITTGTPVGYVTLDGGSQTAIGDVTPVHEGNGQWTFDLTAGEMNGDVVGFLITHASAIPVHFTIKTDTKIVSDLNDIAAGASMALTAAAVDAIMDEVITPGAHNVANSFSRVLRTLREYRGYEDGFIFIDTVNGVAGTTDFENGTSSNPVDTLADAVTLGTSLGIKKFKLSPGSSITLASAFVGFEFAGSVWDLALGGQDISKAYISGASITGIGTAPTGGFELHNCQLGTSTLGSCDMHFCGLSSSTITLSAADGYRFDHCSSMVAGLSAPIIDFGAAVGNTFLSMRHYSGGVEFKNMNQTGTDIISLEGKGQYILNANCVGGTLAVRGLFDKTDNSGSVSITETARYDTTQIKDAILPKTNTALNNLEFLFVAASDHVTPVTGATGSAVTRSIDGGAFGAGTGSLAEVGNGIYQYDASAADMNGGIITFRFTATGGTPGAPDDVFMTIITGAGV